MDGGGVERVLGPGQPQEAGALLERFGAKALDLFELAREVNAPSSSRRATMFLAVAAGDAGHPPQQRGRGSVEIDADRVDAILNNAVKSFAQPLLGHIVLVLADADGFGVDLDKFGERGPAGGGQSRPRCAG